MESGSAFRAEAFEIRIGRERDRTTETSRSNYILHEARKLGPGDIEGRLGTRQPGAFRTVRFRPAVRIVIAVLPVFAISVHMWSIDSLESPAAGENTSLELVYFRELDVHQVQFQRLEEKVSQTALEF